MFDVFISYGHDLKDRAFEMLESLERRGLNCWIAPRNITGTYASSIIEGIENSKVFVILLCQSSNTSIHVLNEVEKAVDQFRAGKIQIVPFKCEEFEYGKEMSYYISRIQWVDGYSEDKKETAYDELYNRIVDVAGIQRPSNSGERKNVQYLSETDKVEFQRLKTEEELLYPYEAPIYDRLFQGKRNVNVLDFNFLNAESSFKRLVRPEVNRVCCFGYNDYYVSEANRAYDENPAIKFYKIDVNEDDIAKKLSDALEDSGIKSFDFVNLTMALLDLKQPYKVLKQIRNFLSDDAVFYVRDIDDGVVFAYPDEKRLFEQVKELYKKDRLSGSRESARQVYNIFKRLGARDIRLEYSGIATDQMSFRQKEMLFDAWFGFIPNDYKIMGRDNPRDPDVQKGLAWIDEHFDSLEEAYHSDNFLFNSGYFIYTIQF